MEGLEQLLKNIEMYYWWAIRGEDSFSDTLMSWEVDYNVTTNQLTCNRQEIHQGRIKKLGTTTFLYKIEDMEGIKRRMDLLGIKYFKEGERWYYTNTTRPLIDDTSYKYEEELKTRGIILQKT